MLLHIMIMCLFTLPFTIIAMGTTLQGSNYSSSSMNNIAKPGCPTKCGNVTVPYPFGIGTGCSLNDVFNLTCTTSSDSDKTPLLFINSGETLRTDNISGQSYTHFSRGVRIQSFSDTELRIFNSASVICYQQEGINISFRNNSVIDLSASAGLFSLSEKNKFTVIGCFDRGLITAGYSLTSGCTGFCNNATDVADGQCSGNGCCQTSITKGCRSYEVTIESDESTKRFWESNRCSYAFVGEEGSFEFHGIRDLFNNNASEVVERIDSTVPIVIDWVIVTDRNCSEATECKDNSHCYDVGGAYGYRCRCNKGYDGNPYLDSGCQDIDECHDPETYPCYGNCNNTRGSYECNCPPGGFGDAKRYKCVKVAAKRSDNFTIIFILGILALLAIVIGLLGLYFMAQKRKQVKLREKYYEQNGGALLKDKLKTKGGVDVSSINIFRVEELKKATDNFAESNILGKGGNGTVYKGTLTDGRLVAIKKSQRVDKGQREDFINEMVILTQINHTNVVQLIGFCLETEVPLLAYEFVSNDTLYHHIHNSKTGPRRLSWDTRLKIAHESAGALAYIHTDTRMSIIHRDVKSANILLDENYTAKIADFGASRLVPLGHDEVTTLVQGTLGYLDPEYFQSGHLTDRSDVYSFGVVLAELLTGQKPLNVERCEEGRNLAIYFVKAVEENNFLDILEQGVVKEAGYEQLKAISDLVCRCLNLVGANRPSMKEVTMELDTLRKLGKHTNWVREDNYNETRSLIEMETTDPDTVPPMPTSDTMEDSSIIG